MKEIVLIICVLIILFWLLAFHSYIKIDITRFKIENEKIPSEFNGYKILHLSDLHNRNLEKKILSVIKKEKPNIVIMTGDMIDDTNGMKYDNFLSLVNKIDLPVYYIYGNHEENFKAKDLVELNNDLKKANVKLINNTKIELTSKGKKVYLYGLSHPLRYYRKDNKEIFESSDVEKLLGKPDEKYFNMLLAHNPIFADDYSKWGSDLTFSGHIHGGLINLPIVGGLLSPDVTFFPKYYKGMYEIDDCNLIVSRGLGYGGQLKFRILNPGEIVVVELENK